MDSSNRTIDASGLNCRPRSRTSNTFEPVHSSVVRCVFYGTSKPLERPVVSFESSSSRVKHSSAAVVDLVVVSRAFALKSRLISPSTCAPSSIDISFTTAPDSFSSFAGGSDFGLSNTQNHDESRVLRVRVYGAARLRPSERLPRLRTIPRALGRSRSLERLKCADRGVIHLL